MSDDCCTTSVYYEPPPVHPDSGLDIPWLLILPLIIFLAALILLYFLSTSGKDKPETPREKINKVIDELADNADLFERKEAAKVLQRARTRINDILNNS